MERLQKLVLDKEMPEYLGLLMELYESKNGIHTEKYSPIYQRSKNLEAYGYVAIKVDSIGVPRLIVRDSEHIRLSEMMAGTAQDTTRERVIISITDSGRELVEDALKETREHAKG